MTGSRPVRDCQTRPVSGEQVVEATVMRDALGSVPGVLTAVLELDAAGPAVLRIRLAPGADQDEVVGAALDGMRGAGSPLARAGGGRLRLVGPDGQGVVAVVDDASADLPSPVARRRGAHRREDPPPVGLPAGQVSGLPVGQVSGLPVGPVSAQVSGPQPGRAAVEPARLVLERVEVASERLQLWATVHLARGELRFSGTAGGSASGTGAHRAVAAATARAAESALGDGVRLDVEAVDVVAVGQDRIGVVIVTLLTERGLDRLTGAALVRGDGRETIVRATLDALNRRAKTQGRDWHAPHG